MVYACLLALLPAGPPPEGYAYPSMWKGAVELTLEVHVDSRPAAPGQGRVTYTLTAIGPAGLEVLPPRLEDAGDAWKARWRASSWEENQGRATWGQSIELVQVRPGPAPLPGVRARFRGGPAAPWQEAAWADILKEPREAPAIDELPPLPPSPWPARLGFAAAAMAGVAVLLGGAWVVRRRRTAPAPALPPYRRALADLEDLAADPPQEDDKYHARLARVLRAYVAERFDSRAARLTSGELMAALAGHADLGGEQRKALADVLARCDLVLFAGATAPAEDRPHTLGMAREFVEQTAPAAG
jgi:hypothetical protein